MIAEIEEVTASEQDAAALALVDHPDRRAYVRLTDEQLAGVRRRMDDPHQVMVRLEEVPKHFGVSGP